MSRFVKAINERVTTKDGKVVVVTPGQGCTGCHFESVHEVCTDYDFSCGPCHEDARPDHTGVIFKLEEDT